MHVLTVTFGLNGLSAEEYAALSAQAAPHFAALPGLISKHWLNEPASNTYGGVYLWESREALEAYLVSATFRALLDNPAFVDVTATAFDTLAAPAEYTALPLRAAA